MAERFMNTVCVKAIDTVSLTHCKCERSHLAREVGFFIDMDGDPVADFMDTALRKAKFFKKRTCDLCCTTPMLNPTVFIEILAIGDIMEKAGDNHPGFIETFFQGNLTADIRHTVSMLKTIRFGMRTRTKICRTIEFLFKKCLCSTHQVFSQHFSLSNISLISDSTDSAEWRRPEAISSNPFLISASNCSLIKDPKDTGT